MKVKLIKDHLANKIGEVIEVTPERANYFVLHKVAEIVKQNIEHKKNNKK